MQPHSSDSQDIKTSFFPDAIISAKDNFQRVCLFEAHDSLFDIDLISICETSLNDSVELPEPPLNEYTFVPANIPANTRRGGVGLFYKKFSSRRSQNRFVF